MIKVFIKIIICLFFLNNCYGQTLSGLWKGNTEHSILMLNPTSSLLEIEIINDSVITGVGHNYYKKGKYEHFKISGLINWKDSVFYIEDGEEISHNINSKLYETCLGRMQLKLTQKENVYYLNGKWKDKSKKLFHCPTLSLSFEKAINDTVNWIKEGVIKNRETDVQKVIELFTDEVDSIKCSIYDNGEIDNDTATVYFNDSLVFDSQRLSQQPIEFYLSLDKTKQIHKIKLIANNLGSIPPNTALLVITTRKNRYTITLSSSFAKNGSVEFFLKE